MLSKARPICTQLLQGNYKQGKLSYYCCKNQIAHPGELANTCDRTSTRCKNISIVSSPRSSFLIPLTLGNHLPPKIASRTLTNDTNLQIKCSAASPRGSYLVAAFGNLTFFKPADSAIANTAAFTDEYLIIFQTVKITAPASTSAWYFGIR